MKKGIPSTIEGCIDKKRYQQAYKMAKEQGRVSDLIGLLSTNHHCQQAFPILRAEGLSFLDFPALLERVEKKYVRFLQKSFTWEQIELRLISSRQLMAYYAEDLFYNHGKPEPGFRDIALSLVARHGLAPDLKKVELIKEVGSEFQFRENVYLTQDAFRGLTSPH